MSTLPEFVGTIHIFLGPYRGNPIALYLRQEGESCQISPTIYPWNRFIGTGETVNKAAADFDLKWKESDLTAEMYSGPHWEGGIKPEKPKPPPKPAAPPKPATDDTATTEAGAATTKKPQATSTEPDSAKPAKAPATSPPALDGTGQSQASTSSSAQPEPPSENPVN